MSENFWEDSSQLISNINNATASQIVYPPGGRFGPRNQTNLQFVLVHRGHVDIHVDEQVLFAPAGYVFLLYPNHREDFYFAKSVETNHSWIHIEIKDLNPAFIQNLESLPRSIPLSDAMNNLTDTIKELTHSLTHNSHIKLRCTLAAAAIMLYQTESQNGWLEKGKHPCVIRAKAEIHKSYEESLNLDKLAGISNVSSEHLIRLFGQSEGVTPMRYLWKVRVNHALELLYSTGLTLDEIAGRTGFKSMYHLSRMIKNISGQTPTEIRRSSWKASNAE